MKTQTWRRKRALARKARAVDNFPLVSTICTTMTIKEAAKELGCSAWTLRRLLQKGKFPGIKRRAHWEIPKNYQRIMNQNLLRSFQGIPSEEYATRK